MDTSASRTKILHKIQTSLQGAKVKMPFPEVANDTNSVFHGASNDIAEFFAAEFIKLGGKFLYCENELEMIHHLVKLADTNDWTHVHCNEPFFINYFSEHDIAFTKSGNNYTDMQAAVTSCESAIARLGSLAISSASASGRVLSVYCPVHICIVYANQIVWDIEDSTNALLAKYKDNLPSMLNIATGPSRTADIEKTLVVGVHGPKEVYVLFIDKDAPYS
jgi:L-lactate dehydrogenase complex protein LldG